MMSGTSPLLVRVARRRMETESTVSLDLVSAQGNPLPGFTPGAHIDVHLPMGLVRQYSLCSPPDQPRYQIAVLLNPSSRGGSKAVHDHVREGDVLEISHPRNLFPLQETASESVLVAGGIGITPILCMAESLAARGRQFRLHYCVRAMQAMAFHERITASSFADQVAFHCDDGQLAQRFDPLTWLHDAARDAHIYVCGPSKFMDTVLACARSAGWPDAHLHYERFSAPAAVGGDSGFEIELTSSGRIVVVTPNQSAAQALADAGIDLSVSCEQGICGTCLTRVIAGEPDHRDTYLSAAQQAGNSLFTPCCSRSRTARLVLDL